VARSSGSPWLVGVCLSQLLERLRERVFVDGRSACVASVGPFELNRRCSGTRKSVLERREGLPDLRLERLPIGRNRLEATLRSGEYAEVDREPWRREPSRIGNRDYERLALEPAQRTLSALQTLEGRRADADLGSERLLAQPRIAARGT
jgi:hypothetical protein